MKRSNVYLLVWAILLNSGHDLTCAFFGILCIVHIFLENKMNTLFVIDLDGTICHAGRRFEAAGAEPSRDNKEVYEAWVNAVQSEGSLKEDKPVAGMLALVESLESAGAMVIYLTSREEKWRSVTAHWLSKHNFPHSGLIMRPQDDYREGAEFKEAMIKILLSETGCSHALMIDDDERGTIEEMCHKNGWTFLRARSGGQI